MLFRKDVLYKVGLFDKSSGRTCEFDLALRLIEKGYKLDLEPDSVTGYGYTENLKKQLVKDYLDAKMFARLIYPKHPQLITKKVLAYFALWSGFGQVQLW